MEALESFRVPGPVQDPEPLEYLRHDGDGSFDINLEAYLKGEKQRKPKRISSSNFRSLYWSGAQMVTDHTIGGCDLNVGDLLGTGTISGQEKDSRGSLLELTWRGTERIFLMKMDRESGWNMGRLTITGWCQGDGYRIGFGEVTGTIASAHDVKKILSKQALAYNNQ